MYRCGISGTRDRRTRATALAAVLLLVAVPAQAAQTGNSGISDAAVGKGNTNYCEIIVTRNGMLVPNVGATVLGSANPGGLSGAAEVTATNSSFSLTAETPIGFAIGPVGASQDVTFSATVSGNGATAFLAEPGNIPVRIKKGTTSIEANLTATRISGAFPAGHYRADMILRCE
jgi:hypothetical protein